MSILFLSFFSTGLCVLSNLFVCVCSPLCAGSHNRLTLLLFASFNPTTIATYLLYYLIIVVVRCCCAYCVLFYFYFSSNSLSFEKKNKKNKNKPKTVLPLFSSPSVTVPSPRIDPEVEDIVKSTLPPGGGVVGAVGSTALDEYQQDGGRLDEELTLSEETHELGAAVQVGGDSLPASKRVESPQQLPIDPEVFQQELTVSSTNSTTISQV